MSLHSWRKALAVPAVVSLAFGGALLAVSPALATPAEPAAAATAPDAAVTTTTTSTTTAATDPAATTAAAAAAEPAADPTTTAPNPDPTTTEPNPDPTTTSATPTPTETTTTPTPTDTSTSAPTGTFAVLTPLDGVPSPTTTPVFAGTGDPGSIVIIDYIGADKGLHDAGSTTVGDDGTWTITTAFPDLGPGVTKVVLTVTENTVEGTPVEGSTPVIRQVSFLKPPVQAQGRSIVLTPDYPTVDGASTTGVGLAVTGFTAGETLAVTLTGPGGKTVAWTPSESAPAADADGAFSELLALPADSVGGDYVVTVTGATSHLVLTKTAYVLGDPTITSPTAGERIVGSTVTFTGTGTPGSSIGLVILPTSDLDAATASLPATDAAEASSSTAAGSAGSTPVAPAAEDRAAAAAAAADPTDAATADPTAGDGNSQNIPVGTDGTWNVTVTLADPGDYTAVAIAGIVDANGDPVSDNTGLPVLSGPSADVEFVLAASVVTTSGSGTELAFTGSNAAPSVIAGGFAILLGAGLLVATRRRRDGRAE